MIARRARRVLAAAVSLSLLAGACSGGEDDADGGRLGRGLPCPDGSVLGCPVLAATLSIPVAGTGLQLVYRSDRRNRESHAALGGWSLAGYDELDLDAGTVLTGAGDLRPVAEIGGARGEVLVPSADGTTVAVFSDGVHERTVDAFTGIELARYGHLDGRLTEVTDRFGSTTTIERDAEGRPVAVVASGGVRTALHVDGNGWLVATTDRFGTGWSLAYADGGAGLLASATDGAGTGPQFTYDGDGLLKTSRDADGVETRWSGSESDDATVVVAVTPSGATMRWTDRRDGDERTITVDREGGDRVTEELAADGSSRLVLADGTEVRHEREPDPRWEGRAPRVVAATVTTPGGRSTTVSEHVEVTTDEADPLVVVEARRELSTGDATTSATWDGAERLLSSTNAAGITTAVQIDGRGQLTEVRRADAPSVRIERDDSGRPTAIDDGRGISRIAYPEGPEAVVTDPLGREWRSAVDSAGNLTSILDPDGRRITVERNTSGRPVAFSVDGAQVHGAAWTPAGRSAGRSGPYDETIRHDEDGRPITLVAGGGGEVSLGYDEGGDLESLDTGSNTLTFERALASERSTSDASGVEQVVERDGPLVHRVATSGPVAGVVAYAYDDALQLASLDLNGTEVAIGREASGRITEIGDLVLEWDGAGQLAETSLGRVTSVRRHDELGDLEAEEWLVADAALLTLSVARDALARAASETTSGPAGTITTAFTYDAAGRVTGAVQGPATWGFEWDRHDNLTAITRPSGREDLTYDGRDRLTQRGAISYRWRDDGALTGWTDAAGATALHVDARGRMTGADLPDGRTITYLLDAEGRRVAREVDGTLQQGYLYDHGDAPVALIGADGDVVQRYVRTDSEAPAFILAGDVTYRVVSDRRGSPRAVVDVATGQVVQELDYDPLGRITRDSNPGFQPFGFGGGLVDPDTGLVHFGAREYDPATGRFTTPDPLLLAGGQLNPYVFGDGDPVNLVDPRGLQAAPPGSGEPNGDPSGAFPDLQGFVDTVLDPGPPSQGLLQFGRATYGLSKLEPELNRPLEGIGKAGGYLDWAGKLGVVNATAGWSGLRAYATELKLGGQIAPQGLGAVSGALGVARILREGVTADSSPRNVIDTVKDTMEGLELVSPYAAEAFGHLFTAYVFGKLVPEAFEGTGEAGGSYGDPHLATIDGLHYDFQGAGEYVLVRSDDGTTEVQVRQQPVRGMRTVTVNTAVAARVGASRVTVGPDGAVLVDGQAVVVDGGAVPLDGGSVRRDTRGEVIVVADGAMTVGITRYESHLDVRVAVDPALAGEVVGLLGDGDGDPANDLTSADGQSVERDGAVDATADDPLHAVFGESWRVTSGTTLFPYAPGTDTGTFTDRSIPAEGSGVDALDADTRAAAEAICRGAGVLKQPFLDDCTIDVALTGDPALATSASRSQRSAASGGSVRVRPGDMTDEEGGAIHLGEDVEGDLEVGQRRTYTFEADARDFVYLASLSGLCEVEVHVIAPDGESLSRSGACLDTGRLELSGDGAYEVAVSAPTIAGKYGFVLLESGPDERRELRVGDEVEGTIELPGVRHVYALDAEPGRALLIVGRAATCDVSIRPHDADGDSFAAPGGLCGDLPFDVPADGRAQLIVTAFEEKTGPYVFRLDPAPP